MLFSAEYFLTSFPDVFRKIPNYNGDYHKTRTFILPKNHTL